MPPGAVGAIHHRRRRVPRDWEYRRTEARCQVRKAAEPLFTRRSRLRRERIVSLTMSSAEGRLFAVGTKAETSHAVASSRALEALRSRASRACTEKRHQKPWRLTEARRAAVKACKE